MHSMCVITERSRTSEISEEAAHKKEDDQGDGMYPQDKGVPQFQAAGVRIPPAEAGDLEEVRPSTVTEKVEGF